MPRQPWEPHVQHVVSPGLYVPRAAPAAPPPWPPCRQARAPSCPAKDKQSHQASFQNTGPQRFTLPHGLGTWKVETIVEVILLPGRPRRHLP